MKPRRSQRVSRKLVLSSILLPATLVFITLISHCQLPQPSPTSVSTALPTLSGNLTATPTQESDAPTGISAHSTEPSATRLAVPSPISIATHTPASETRLIVYIVQHGDTLSSIAERFGVDLSAIAAVNDLVDVNRIQVGQSLIIPDGNHVGLPTTMTPDPQETSLPPNRSKSTPSVPNPYPVGHELGRSTGGWPIEYYQIGEGATRVALIGGIHGGYEWNTILLAHEAIDFFVAHPEQVPDSISLYIVPAANPDGQVAIVSHAGRFSYDEVASNTVPGRFNANGVDLNRNWDCNWTPTGFWREQEVSAGSAPFSEVETQILRDFLTSFQMDAVVFWHSAKPGVYASGCDTILSQSHTLAAVYAAAAKYPLIETFYDYIVNGDAADWLSSHDIPAISVELSNHTDVDWTQNFAGMHAILSHLGAAQLPLESENEGSGN